MADVQYVTVGKRKEEKKEGKKAVCHRFFFCDRIAILVSCLYGLEKNQISFTREYFLKIMFKIMFGENILSYLAFKRRAC